MTAKLTTKEFIDRATKLHKDKYCYDKSEYTGALSKIIIICNNKDHFGFEFKQLATAHLHGQNCPRCTGYTQHNVDTPEFIRKAKLIHGDKYCYDKVKYVKSTEKVTIICRNTHYNNKDVEWEQTPANHLHGFGCPVCGNRKKLNLEEFIEKAILVHGDKYDYSKVVYSNIKAEIIIICKDQNHYGLEFKQVAHNHLNGAGCHICGGSQKLTVENLLKEQD